MGEGFGESGILTLPMGPVNDSDASPASLEGLEGLFGFPEFCDTFGRLSERCPRGQQSTHRAAGASTRPHPIVVGQPMGILSSEAIILRTYPLRETDKLVVAYTRRYGKVRGVAHGSRRIKSRFSGRLEPLSWVELVAVERRNRELVSIDKVELLKGYGLAIQDYPAYLRSSYMLELLMETVPEHEVNDSLFRLLLHVLPLLGDSRKSRLASVYFQIWHLKLAGLLPSLTTCSGCRADLGSGTGAYSQRDAPGFFCRECRKGTVHRIDGNALELAGLVVRKSLPDLAVGQVSPEAVSALNAVAEEMVQAAFERKFDSLSLLRRELGNR